MNARVDTQEASPVSLGDWILTLVVLAIPIVGIVMMFVWAFAGGTHPSKQNYCRATLILALIGFVLFVLFLVMGGFAALFAIRGMDGGAL
ncbi:MAG: hypothetical protein ACREP2_02825 [Rhodanobacteraceae bacterium]